MWWGNILALLIAAVFGLAGYRLRIPGGMILGAMLGVIIFNILTGMVAFPVQARAVSQSLVGGVIAVSVTREFVRSLRTFVKSAVVLTICMTISGFLVGYILYRLNLIDDLATSLFASAPGGLADMALIAMEMGIDSSRVITLQIIRLVSIIAICPQLYRVIARRYNPPVSAEFVIAKSEPEAFPTQEAVHTSALSTSLPYPQEGRFHEKAVWVIRKSALTIVVAIAGGIVGFFIGVPAGVLIFSMIAVIAFNFSTGKGYMPKNLRRFAQVIAGTIIGQNIGANELPYIIDLIIPGIILVLIYIALSFVIAFIMRRLCGLDLITALFASAPGGASDMALIADDMGGNSPIIATMHIVRIVGVIIIFPQITFLIMLFNR